MVISKYLPSFHPAERDARRSPSLPWVPWAMVPPLLGYYAPLRLPPLHLGGLRLSLACPLPCLLPWCSWGPVRARGRVEAARPRQGLWSPGPLSPGMGARREVALPSSRVPPGKTCPALRPRWWPAHSPSRPQDCCLPGHATRRLPTTIPISGRHPAACLLASPGSVHSLTAVPAGSLLPCWLGFGQGGLAHPARTHWVTTTNFMSSHSLPRFRASLARACLR